MQSDNEQNLCLMVVEKMDRCTGIAYIQKKYAICKKKLSCLKLVAKFWLTLTWEFYTLASWPGWQRLKNKKKKLHPG